MSNQIKLVLIDLNNGEKFTTGVDSEEDIVSFTTSYDLGSDETIVYAFESNAELFRLNS